MKFRENCRITETRTDGVYLSVTMETEKIAGAAKAGQFVNIRADESFEPLLRRPFSICDIDGKKLTLLVLLKGAGTRKIAAKKAGDTLNVIGPLGNGFPVSNGKKAVFVAGGVGIAPFRLLSKNMAGSVLLFGAKNKSLVPDLTDYKKTCEVRVATENGSMETKGTVIDLLTRMDFKDRVIYACGPNPMLRALTKVFSNCAGIEAYYSIETVMGCGFGACKGCAVETPAGDYALACTDGPVFFWKDIQL